MMTDISKGFLSLCYHYVRPSKDVDPFPRILGAREAEFKEHLNMLLKQYHPLSPNSMVSYMQGNYEIPRNRQGILFTFDDGLADQFRAAEILAEHGVRGIFFINTCSLVDGMPANPTIIHYTLAEFGIEKFLEAMDIALRDAGIQDARFRVHFRKGQDNPWDIITAIKRICKYELGYHAARQVLLSIYEQRLHAKYPKAVEIMHLTRGQIQRMLAMGHTIGVHTYSHSSVATFFNDPDIFAREVIEPKNFLEREFGITVDALSYPFGGVQDCLSPEELLKRTDIYTFAYTVEKKINTPRTSPLAIRRYEPMSNTSGAQLIKIVESFTVA